MDRDFVNILNVLSLLREKPLTNDELLKSGCFKTKGQLDYALIRLKEANCIEKIHSAKIYCILGYGLTLLSLYPTWTPVEVLDVIVPIGRERGY